MDRITALPDDALLGVEITLGGNPATRSIRKSDAFKLSVDNTVFVDAVNGDDANGLRARPDRPFATMTAAEAAAQDFDTVYVLPGTYTQRVNSNKQLIWDFSDGAQMVFTGAGTSPILSGPTTGLFVVRGRGKFTSNSAVVFTLLAVSGNHVVSVEAQEVNCTYASGDSKAISILNLTSTVAISVKVHRVVATTVTSAVEIGSSNVSVEIDNIVYTGAGQAVYITSGGCRFFCGGSITSTGDGIRINSGSARTLVEYMGSLSVSGAGKRALVVGSDNSSARGVVVNIGGTLSAMSGNAVEITEGGATLNLARVTASNTCFVHSNTSILNDPTTINVDQMTGPSGIYAPSGKVLLNCIVATCSTVFVNNGGGEVLVANRSVTTPKVLLQTSGLTTGQFNTVACANGNAVDIGGGSSSLDFVDLVVTGTTGYAVTMPDTVNGDHVLTANNLGGPQGALNITDLFGSLNVVSVEVQNTISSSGTVINVGNATLNVKATTVTGHRVVARAGSTLRLAASEIRSVLALLGNSVTEVRDAKITASGQIPVQTPNVEGDGQQLLLDCTVVSGGTNVCFRGSGESTVTFRNTVLVSSSGTVADGTGDLRYYGVYANGQTSSTIDLLVNASTVSSSVA